jgi:hypothetical protein
MQESFTSHNKKDKLGKDKYIFHGPWHYFFGRDIKKSIVIIDEIHNFCGCDTPKPVMEAWRRWLGELGHEKSIFRCMTQDAQKLAQCIKSESASIYRLENTSFSKDPLFKIQMYDWQMLANAFLFIPFRQCVICQEEKKDPLKPRSVKCEGVLSYLMGEPFFSMYDSFNKPIEGSQKTEDIKPFETVWEEFRRLHGNVKGRIYLISWFIEKNLVQLLPRIVFIIFILYIVMNFSSIMMSFINNTQQAMKGAIKLDVQQKPDTASEKLRQQDDPVSKIRIVAIMKDCVFTSEGQKISVGESFNGCTLKSIDYKNRKVVFDEKTISLGF